FLIMRTYFIEFVVDIADNFFNDVLQCDQPCEGSVFVNHQREVYPLLLEVLQQMIDLPCFEGKICRADEFLPCEAGSFIEERQKILDVQYAFYPVEVIAANRDTGESRLSYQLEQCR